MRTIKEYNDKVMVILNELKNHNNLHLLVDLYKDFVEAWDENSLTIPEMAETCLKIESEILLRNIYHTQDYELIKKYDSACECFNKKTSNIRRNQGFINKVELNLPKDLNQYKDDMNVRRMWCKNNNIPILEDHGSGRIEYNENNTEEFRVASFLFKDKKDAAAFKLKWQ